MQTKIAVFASGGGSNAEVILRHFKAVPDMEIGLIVSNKASAYVLERAKNHGVASYVHSPEDLENGKLLQLLKENGITFIVLAGYLKKISPELIQAYPNAIVNIHPALLPAYGGKGMYGMRVHEAVFAAGEKESGITIHYVNEHYDEGAVIAQYRCSLDDCLSPQAIQEKVLELEHAHFGRVIESEIRSKAH